jgi:hypothetical protein
VYQTEGKKGVARSKLGWSIYIYIYLKKTEWHQDLNQINVAWGKGTVLGCIEHGNEILGYLKCGLFFCSLGNISFSRRT